MEGARDTRGWKKCWCLLAVLFWASYLQHNLYHTTLFAAFGAKGFWIFALFSASLAVALVSAVLFHTAVLGWFRLRRTALIAAAVSTLGTAALFLAPRLAGETIGVVVGLAGAVCYAVGFAGISLRAFVMLDFYSRQLGLKASLRLISIAFLAALVLFSSSVPSPFYAFAAVGGLGLSGAMQCLFGPLDGTARFPADSSSRDFGVYNRGWRLFYVAVFSAVFLHSILYAADPSLEFLGDAPLSLATSFLLLLALAVSLLASSSSKEGHYWRVVYLAGNGFLAVLLVGLLAVSFFSFVEEDFSVAAGIVLALLRVFDVLLLVGLVISSYSRKSDYVRSGSLYLLALYWLPTLFSYVLLPLAVGERSLDVSALLGPGSLLIAGMLAVALLALLAWLVAKSVPPEGPNGVAPGPENRREVCEALAQRFGLTLRESDVLYYASLGYSSKAIGESLFVAPGTVQSHTKRVYAKLGVHSKQELIELVNDAQTSST